MAGKLIYKIDKARGAGTRRVKPFANAVLDRMLPFAADSGRNIHIGHADDASLDVSHPILILLNDNY